VVLLVFILSCLAIVINIIVWIRQYNFDRAMISFDHAMHTDFQILDKQLRLLKQDIERLLGCQK
jgi:hypothetical protein